MTEYINKFSVGKFDAPWVKSGWLMTKYSPPGEGGMSTKLNADLITMYNFYLKRFLIRYIFSGYGDPMTASVV
jgi:hypothetical protein